MKTVYLACENSDSIEGRGHDVILGAFESRDEALKAVKGRGVMGYGDGTIDAIHVFDSIEEWNNTNSIARRKVSVYWGEKWRDPQSAWFNTGLEHDPEYDEYLRLKDRFGS